MTFKRDSLTGSGQGFLWPQVFCCRCGHMHTEEKKTRIGFLKENGTIITFMIFIKYLAIWVSRMLSVDGSLACKTLKTPDQFGNEHHVVPCWAAICQCLGP